jgi:hypothetical protein
MIHSILLEVLSNQPNKYIFISYSGCIKKMIGIVQFYPDVNFKKKMKILVIENDFSGWSSSHEKLMEKWFFLLLFWKFVEKRFFMSNDFCFLPEKHFLTSSFWNITQIIKLFAKKSPFWIWTAIYMNSIVVQKSDVVFKFLNNCRSIIKRTCPLFSSDFIGSTCQIIQKY